MTRAQEVAALFHVREMFRAAFAELAKLETSDCDIVVAAIAAHLCALRPDEFAGTLSRKDER